MDTTKKYYNPNPQVKANVISKLFFCWLLPFVKYGYLHDLAIKDVYNTTKSDSSKDLTDVLERHWMNELKEAGIKNTKPSLLRAIRKTFWKSTVFVGFFWILRAVVYTYCMPLALSKFIHSFSEVPRSSNGWFLGCAVMVLPFLNCLTSHHMFLYCNRIGMRVRIACSSLIYRKMLKLDKIALDDTDVGKLSNLLSNDVNRFDMAAGAFHNIWVMPIQAIIGTYVMYTYVGFIAFVGIGALIFQAVPIHGTFSRLQGKFRFKVAVRTDRRVKLMSEITSGIQVIKMYGWEKPFGKMVALFRKEELNVITKTSYIKGCASALRMFTERLTLYIIVITFVALGSRLTGAVIFPVSHTINVLHAYMCIMFPMALAFYSEAETSTHRIENFLMKSEKQLLPNQESATICEPGLVKLEKVYASWTPNAKIETLVNLTVEVKPGSLCCIVGNVGSGKSSILHLLLRELAVSSGKMHIGGSVSYASQEPWLFVSNIRNNILFGQPFIKDKYDKVVQVCALQRDFELFPFGDKTNVGEKGVLLSGGQRARINLARAVYRDADIYLFDDPLSAVDPHVAKHLFEKCMLRYLENKTRILVTHQTQFLNQADFVLVLNNGSIETFSGASTLSKFNQDIVPQSDVEDDTLQTHIQKKSATSLASLDGGEKEETNQEPRETQELIEKGSMSLSVYYDYFRAGASTLVLLIEIMLLLIAQVICNGCDLWVTFWTNNVDRLNKNISVGISVTTLPPYSTETPENLTFTNTVLNTTSLINSTLLVKVADNSTSTKESVNFVKVLGTAFISNETTDISTDIYIQTYTVLLILAVILTTARSIILFKICLRASSKLHNLMFTNILQATMRFFDANPSGRILTRFSKDIGAIDEQLPNSTLTALQVSVIACGILGVTFIKSYMMILPTIFLGILMYWVREIFMKTVQGVKRLEGTTKAPVFSYVTASLDGLQTIRSARAEEMVKTEFDAIQDQHTSTWYLFIATFEAFGIYVDTISTTFLVLATVSFLVNENALTGDVGLVISQCLAITTILQYGMRQIAEVASNMTSVERILQYTKLDKEGPFQTLPANKPPRDWPEAGRITYKNVYLRYLVGGEPVLKNLSLEIQPGQKIGIVGRTGAGKSTLISALFRLAPTDGTIQIDGVDISKIGLTDLRTKISVIPQEPTLFSESIRYNLDPFARADDQILWKALESVELKNAVESLDMKVSEGGSNFSAGQRQLICLARAIVRNNRILVMDEATANVDPQTDALIQKSIRVNFKHCTVLTVAHRLDTIMDSDRVIVMDAGQMLEFGSPYELLQNTSGFFSKMVAETGDEMADKLTRVAQEHYESKKEN